MQMRKVLLAYFHQLHSVFRLVFIPQGTQEEMRAELSLDATGMEAKIKAWLA